ncbi:hypothetical protein SISNIDRAFT_489073 [Sistotremastrum niveocremeum HHB9708]|uniref:Uncharacterized protein n=1 Tax=Sistotremastrum niveocremeum HHB9708 TaxID=1314777 RepID=A0A164QGZ3_9AGAM|nr:hypothetical protein SISNIDRAFT_489073 [Sistotremastrum niveocremeum HHB9708]
MFSKTITSFIVLAFALGAFALPAKPQPDIDYVYIYDSSANPIAAPTLKPAPTIAPIKSIAPANMQHPMLGRALNDLSAAILPRHPLTEITAEDCTKAGDAISIWEKSEEISSRWLTYGTEKPLVDEMISILDCLAAHPDIPGVDISELRDRATALKTKIYGVLLEETRTSKGLECTNEDLSSEWASSLHNHVASLGSHSHDVGLMLRTYHSFGFYLLATRQWYGKNVEKILQYLARLPAPTASSPIWATLEELSHATYIPQSSHRILSQNVLKRWRTGEEIDIASIQPEGRPLEYKRAEVAEKLETIKASTKIGDFKAAEECLGIFETGKGSHRNLIGAIQTSLFEAANNLANFCSEHDLPEPALFARRLRFQFERWSALARAETVDTFTPSISHPHTNSTASINITMRDSTFHEQSWSNFKYAAHVDERTWEDIHFPEVRRDQPMHEFIADFVAAANHRNRHPFSPIHSIDFTFNGTLETGTLHSGRDWYTQGTVADYFAPGSTVTITYTRHDGWPEVLRDRSPEMRMPMFQRMYPPSEPSAPSSWYSLPTPDGPWRKIPSLLFVGDGSELTARTTGPSLTIAKDIFVPGDFMSLGFGWKSLYTATHQRGRVPEALVPTSERITIPMSEEQAKTLLGRTVIYRLEDPEPPAPVLSEREIARAAKKRKREPKKIAERPPPLYCAFVWGLAVQADGKRILLKTFEFSEDSEIGRTFDVGSMASLPASLPSGYPELKKTAVPEWIGLLQPILGAKEEEKRRKKAAAETQARKERLRAILASAPASFEVGIGGDNSMVIGELTLHPPGSWGCITVDGCKAGIWESGVRHHDQPGGFSIWVQWVRDGTIDLYQAVSAFKTQAQDASQASLSVATWESVGSVPVDGGSVSILAKGILSAYPKQAIYGDPNLEQASWIEILTLSGWESGRYHIPGGISSGTGGDGSFDVQCTKDGNNAVIGLRVCEANTED